MLEGSVELFKLTIENGCNIIVNNYLLEPGLLIHEDVLQKLDLELIYLTKEVYKQKRELYKNAHNNEMERIGEKTDDSFTDLFKGFFGSSFMNEQNSLKFYVKDKNNRLVDLQFLDKNDKLIETWDRSSMGSLRTYSFRDSLPGTESKLVIYVASDKSILNVNFKIYDISLP